MDNEVYSFALKNTLNEIHHACPDIAHSFIFKEDGEVMAADDNTAERTMVQVIDAFDGILERAHAIGGIEGIVLDGNKRTLRVLRVDDLYVVTVASRSADMNYVNTLTRVLVPTVLRVIEKIHPVPLQTNPSHGNEVEAEPEIPAFREHSEQESKEKERPVFRRPMEPFEPEAKLEPTLPEPPVNQLIIENLGGLLVPSDTVRIDNEMLSKWEELFEGKKIEEVDVETFNGKATRCRVKPIKDSKFEGKGIIQMPEKIQTTLETRKGELVRVKPVVE